jgi:hypothetical protein
MPRDTLKPVCCIGRKSSNFLLIVIGYTVLDASALSCPVLLQNCRNVLVRSNAAVPGGATAKLADFGLSRAMKQHQTHRTTKTCGTMSHMVSGECAWACAGPVCDMHCWCPCDMLLSVALYTLMYIEANR